MSKKQMDSHDRKPVDSVRIVLTTFPNEEKARQIGTQMVEMQIAACINLVPQIASIYRWQGEVQQDREVLAIIKTSGERIDEVSNFLNQNHPYEVPEFLVIDPLQHAHPYLDWVIKETKL